MVWRGRVYVYCRSSLYIVGEPAQPQHKIEMYIQIYGVARAGLCILSIVIIYCW